MREPIAANFELDTGTPCLRPLRVAVVTETYPPEVNGVAATVARVVEGLRERGHELQVVRPRQTEDDIAGVGPGYSETLVRGLPIPRYPQLKMGLPNKRALVQLWSERRPDVVHLVTEGPLGWSALQAARHLCLPIVSDFRTNFQAYSQHYGIAWLRRPITAYLRAFHNQTACTMVPTEALRSELAAAGFKRLRVVARGVDTQRFDPLRRSAQLRASWGAGPNTLVALTVGRLAPEKNLDTVIAAWQAMCEQDSQVRLVVVGDGPEKQRLMRRCPGAAFAGLRRGDDLAAHYASADVFLFASVTETFGNVVPEAMASGLAVVAYDHAAAGQLIHHGHNGMLARVNDAPGFCAVARRVSSDLAHARSLGLRARASTRRLDWGRIVVQIENEYSDVLPARSALTAPGWPRVSPLT